MNRVVQNPLQLKLQVFKTTNRGWGIRCLNDVPQGAFICIYAGSLLTDTMGNEGGKNYGDEYLAELDYIEVVEAVKEDYEEEVIEPEPIEGDRSPPSRKNETESEDEDDDDEGKERTKSKGRRRRKKDDQNFNPGISDNINCEFSESMRLAKLLGFMYFAFIFIYCLFYFIYFFVQDEIEEAWNRRGQ